MRLSNNPILPLRALVLITTTCLALPLTAAGETQPDASHAAIAVKQPAQQTQTKRNTTANGREPMEEVTVIGQKQIFDLRMQVIQAEDHAYQIFDRLNNDDDYDVHCKLVANTGTHIKKRTCLPNFYFHVQASEKQSLYYAIGSTTDYAVGPSARNVWARKFPVFKAKVIKLAKENPEMMQAMTRLFDLQRKLDKDRKIYYGNTGQ